MGVCAICSSHSSETLFLSLPAFFYVFLWIFRRKMDFDGTTHYVCAACPCFSAFSFGRTAIEPSNQIDSDVASSSPRPSFPSFSFLPSSPLTSVRITSVRIISEPSNSASPRAIKNFFKFLNKKVFLSDLKQNKSTFFSGAPLRSPSRLSGWTQPPFQAKFQVATAR